MFVLMLIFSAVIAALYALLISIVYLHSTNNANRMDCNDEKKSAQKLIICIIVAVRNEEENVRKCIRSLLEINYPSKAKKIIFVNDHSTDETARIISEYKSEGIEILNLPEGLQGKKSAIQYALANIPKEVEYLFFTDGDCQVSSEILNTYNDTIQSRPVSAIVGPVLFECRNDSFICGFQQMDMMGNMAVTNWGINTGRFFLGSGANLLVNKNRFIELNPYSDNLNIPSGDDVFLLRKLYDADPHSAIFVASHEAASGTKALNSWKEIWEQRLRWAGKSRAYATLWILTIQGLVFLLAALFGLNMALFILEDMKYIIPALLLFLTKITVDFVMLRKIYKDYKIRFTGRYYPLLQLVYLVYILVAGFVAFIPLSFKWKSRLHPGLSKN
jgi:poly-beta-1,6-N-acetyl-D-glucosamine synthase